MSLTAYASLKTPHCGVFRALGAPQPLRAKTIFGIWHRNLTGGRFFCQVF